MATTVQRFISVEEADIMPDKRRIRDLETEVASLKQKAADMDVVQEHLETMILQLTPPAVTKCCGVCGHYGLKGSYHLVSADHVRFAKDHGLLLPSAWTCAEHTDVRRVAESSGELETWKAFSQLIRTSSETDVMTLRKVQHGLQYCTVCGDGVAGRSLPFWALSAGVALGLPVISGRLCATCATSRMRRWFTDTWAEHTACLRRCYVDKAIRLAKYSSSDSRLDEGSDDMGTPATPHGSPAGEVREQYLGVDRSVFLQKLKDTHPLAKMTSEQALSLDLDQIQDVNMIDLVCDAVKHCTPVLDEICGFHNYSGPPLSADDVLRSRIAASFFWFALEGIKCRKSLQGFRSLFGVGLDSVRTSQHTLISIVHRHLGLTASAPQTRKILSIHDEFSGLTAKQKEEIAAGITLPIQSWDNLENYEKKAGCKNVFTSGVSHIVVSSPNLGACVSEKFRDKIHPVLDDHWRNLYPALNSPSSWETDFMSQEKMASLFMPNLLPYAGDAQPRLSASRVAVMRSPWRFGVQKVQFEGSPTPQCYTRFDQPSAPCRRCERAEAHFIDISISLRKEN